MKPDLWDAGVLVLTGLYFNSRLNGNKKDYFIRAGAGLVTGIGTAVYGPELIKKLKSYTDKVDKEDLTKISAGGISGILGYTLSDVILDKIQNYKNKNSLNP